MALPLCKSVQASSVHYGTISYGLIYSLVTWLKLSVVLSSKPGDRAIVKRVIWMVVATRLLLYTLEILVYFSFSNGDQPRRKVDATFKLNCLHAVGYRVQLYTMHRSRKKYTRAICEWYLQNRSKNCLFIPFFYPWWIGDIHAWSLTKAWKVGVGTRLVSTGHTRVCLRCRYVRSTQRARARGWEFDLVRDSALSMKISCNRAREL